MKFIRLSPNPEMFAQKLRRGTKKSSSKKVGKGNIYGHDLKDYHLNHPHTHQPRVHVNISVEEGHPAHGEKGGIFSNLGSILNTIFSGIGEGESV